MVQRQIPTDARLVRGSRHASDGAARIYRCCDLRRRSGATCSDNSFPRTDPGQFIINVRMPSGTRLEVSNDYIAKVEDIIRSVVPQKDLDMIVSNIGVYPDLSAIYTTNASMDTAFVQTSLKDGHNTGSYEYMHRVQDKFSREMPELSAYYQAGGLVDS